MSNQDVCLLVSIVVPTFNERDNVAVLVDRLSVALHGISWEVIFVDDNSPDGTADTVTELAKSNPRVRRILRIGRRGLSGAVVEGMLSSTATYVAIIDGDLQHDEHLLPKMLEVMQSGDADLIVGSRYIEGGNSSSFERRRQLISSWSSSLAKFVLRVDLTDPMSGFFMLRQDKAQELAPSLSSQGFKVLLDIVASARGKLRIKELPYTFRSRHAGESKLSSIVALDFVGLLIAKASNDLIPVRFLLFSLVGAVGVAVHLAILSFVLSFNGAPFWAAQAGASTVAMASNFSLNNVLTYRDQRLKGREFLRGLVWFYAVCSIGLLANVGVGSWVFDAESTWLVAGIAGVLVGSIWNYATSSLLVWRRR